MNAWLQDYAYQASIGAGIWVVSMLATLLVAAITVGFLRARAAQTNPGESLWSE